MHGSSPEAVVVLPIVLAGVHATRYYDVFESCSTILVHLPDNVSFALLVLLRLEVEKWRFGV